jgi:hypothetical protein
MTYLIAADLPTTSAGARFRAMLDRPEILQIPGAHNGLAANRRVMPGLRLSISQAQPSAPPWACRTLVS